jgi:hypothetical protein
MAKRHGARQQKKIAKQKAKRSAKRSTLQQRTSNDPTVRLQQAEHWPVVRALMAAELWDQGLGTLIIARQEPEGGLVFAVFLVDVYCLGVKNAFWRAGSLNDLDELIRHVEQREKMARIEPACLVKIVNGAVEYARSFGFSPHPDYRHAAMLLDGIDPATCPKEFTFGKDGKPFYIRGPNESLAQAQAIARRVTDAGGHFLVGGPVSEMEDLPFTEEEMDELEFLDDEDDDESF